MLAQFFFLSVSHSLDHLSESLCETTVVRSVYMCTSEACSCLDVQCFSFMKARFASPVSFKF